jgi:hypothetical protein
MGRPRTVERALLCKLFYHRSRYLAKLLPPDCPPSYFALGFPRFPPRTQPLDDFSISPDGISSIADWTINTRIRRRERTGMFIDDDDFHFDSASRSQWAERGQFIRNQLSASVIQQAAINLRNSRHDLFQTTDFVNKALNRGIASCVDPISTSKGLKRCVMDASYRHKKLG